MHLNTSIPRPEYPRPQMVRNDWINLNGEWEFEIDSGKTGKDRELYKSEKLSKKIIVPFCPESKLSGIEYKDFMPAVWYRRNFSIPDGWKSNSVILHFGAVDYYATVWINGQFAGEHRGGYTPFEFDITKFLQPGDNVISVCAEDDVRSGLQPGGKQSRSFDSHGCYYTRVTGIWQTVWLESVSPKYISKLKYIPDLGNCQLFIEASISGMAKGSTLSATALYGGKEVGSKSVIVTGDSAMVTLELSENHVWEMGNPCLYDLELDLSENDTIIDKVESYFGLRTISLTKNVILINGKPVYQRLVLDQGFYPDGIYTAPTDEDLKKDIEIGMGLGFNGARLHEKVFEPRYLYWADKLGYLVWGEYGNWSLDITTAKGLEIFLPEWIESVERDFNHPSIVGWCPFNETWDANSYAPHYDGKFSHRVGTKQDDEVLRIVYNTTKMLDKTRPVIDTSGNYHVITDIFDVHEYEGDVEEMAKIFDPMKNDEYTYVTYPNRQKYEGQPYFVSEYGGIWWNPETAEQEGWGYGDRPTTEKEFLDRYDGLTKVLLDNPRICAFCYTQLYDVEQEVNGLYTYDRKPKFNPEIIRKINSAKAAIEK